MILVVLSTSFAENKFTLSDDQCITEIFLKYAGLLKKVSYKEVKEQLDSLGCEYETTIGSNAFATFNIQCERGKLYIEFYPLDIGYDSLDYGQPEKEMLSCLSYSRDDYRISISDNLHLNMGVIKTSDESRNPVSVEVPSLDYLIEFYNNIIGGSVTFEQETPVFSESYLKSKIEDTIIANFQKYDNTTIKTIEINSTSGTVDPDDFHISIYLKWDTKNSISTTRNMLAMISDEMAAELTETFSNIYAIYLFWEVPYLYKADVCAKYAYSILNGMANRKETTGLLYR